MCWETSDIIAAFLFSLSWMMTVSPRAFHLIGQQRRFHKEKQIFLSRNPLAVLKFFPPVSVSSLPLDRSHQTSAFWFRKEKKLTEEKKIFKEILKIEKRSFSLNRRKIILNLEVELEQFVNSSNGFSISIVDFNRRTYFSVASSNIANRLFVLINCNRHQT